jgi:hypothetical protein
MTATSNKPSEQVNRRCTMVIPGLLDLPVAESASAFSQLDQLPAMELFLSRAKRQRFSGAGLETVLFDLFDVEQPADADKPVAAITYAGDTGEPSTGWCLRADPVHLVPDRDQLVLMMPEILCLSQAEADRLVADINVLFAEDGWRLEVGTPTRWYLHLPDDPQLRTHDLSQVRSHAIGDFLPTGPNGRQWHRVMNEVQMVLHASVVNTERQSLGQLPVSSLWFWGGGQSPQVGHSRWSKLWSHEPVSLGLAALSSTPKKPLPASASEWLQTSIEPGAHLLVLDDLQKAWQFDGIEAWQQRLHNIDETWIAPLLSALRQGDITELTLCTCQGHRFSITRTGLKRWWRRKRVLARYC